MPVAEWLARRIDFKDSMCSLHAALCLRDGLYTPPAPEPGRLRVIWTCTSPSAEWRRLKLWRNFFHRPIQCNHTSGLMFDTWTPVKSLHPETLAGFLLALRPEDFFLLPVYPFLLSHFEKLWSHGSQMSTWSYHLYHSKLTKFPK